jgi:hypothetical protein
MPHLYFFSTNTLNMIFLVTNILAYFAIVNDSEKCFIRLDTGLNVIKLFTSVIYEFS